MKKFICPIVGILLLIMGSCDQENGNTNIGPAIETQEEAQSIAFSLDSIKNLINDKIQSIQIDPREQGFILNADGKYTGGVSVSGIDYANGAGGHSGANWRHNASGSLIFYLYEDEEGVVLQNEGSLSYRSERRINTMCPFNPCMGKLYRDTLEISSANLKVEINKDDKKISDVVQIKFSYTWRYDETLGGVVQDSSTNNHYIVTTSKGLVFEW